MRSKLKDCRVCVCGCVDRFRMPSATVLFTFAPSPAPRALVLHDPDRDQDQSVPRTPGRVLRLSLVLPTNEAPTPRPSYGWACACTCCMSCRSRESFRTFRASASSSPPGMARRRAHSRRWLRRVTNFTPNTGSMSGRQAIKSYSSAAALPLLLPLLLVLLSAAAGSWLALAAAYAPAIRDQIEGFVAFGFGFGTAIFLHASASKLSRSCVNHADAAPSASPVSARISNFFSVSHCEDSTKLIFPTTGEGGHHFDLGEGDPTPTAPSRI